MIANCKFVQYIFCVQFFSIILSGGAGTRLWPISRKDIPKQFSPMFQPNLFTQTITRLKPHGNILVVTSKHLENLTKNSLTNAEIILEPGAKGTALSALLATLTLVKQGFEDSIMGIFPSDHLIKNQTSFNQNIKLAIKTAQLNNLVTFGITPAYATSEYGYIKHTKNSNPSDVLEFVEKPSLQKAKQYIKSSYLWNSGIFIIKVKNLIDLYKIHAPKIYEKLKDADLSNLDKVYQNLPVQSFDVEIAEKTKGTKVIKSDFGWQDVGNINNWPNKNPLIEHEAKDNNFYSTNTDKLSVFLGIQNLTIVDSPDAILILDKDKSHKLKEVYEKISTTKYANSNTVKKPWGEFEKIKTTPDTSIKIIRVNPKCRLSYQSHNKRSEHWTITKGVGKVTLDGKTTSLNAGDHIHIPTKARHRIENPTDIILEFVEVQLGEYFGEDDIIRYEDDYGRAKK